MPRVAWVIVTATLASACASAPRDATPVSAGIESSDRPAARAGALPPPISANAATGDVFEEELATSEGLAPHAQPAVSADGRHYALLRTTVHGWRGRAHSTVVVDGVAGPMFDEVIGPLMTAAGHVAYAGRDGESWTVMANGSPWPTQYPRMVDSFALDGPWATFSQDGRRLAVLVPRSGAGKAGVRSVLRPSAGPEPNTLVVDSQQVSPPELRFVFARSVAFGPDGRRLAYAGRRHDGKWVLIVDGQAQGRPFDEPSRDPVGFSPDGKRWVYVVAEGRSRLVYVDGVVQGAWGDASVPEPKWSENSAHLIHTAHDGKDAVVVLDGQVVYRAPALASAAVFTTGARWAVVARPAERRLVEVRDGVAGTPIEVPKRVHDTSWPELSPDGARMVYWGLESHLTLLHRHYDPLGLVVDGRWQADPPHLPQHRVAWSPDSGHMAYVSRARDHARRGFLGRPRRAQTVMVGGDSSPLYETIVPGTLHFEDSRTVVFVAKRDNVYRRVTWRPAALGA